MRTWQKARSAFSILSLASIAALFAAACDSRIEEPVPTTKPAAAKPSVAATGDTVPASTSMMPPATAASGGSASAPRCIKPTPATAQRTVTGKVPDPNCPKDPETQAALRTGKVIFTDAKAQTVTVEVTENDHDRQRGLMYRKSMADDRGMIFTFEEHENHRFWMHNTCIPLDMLFIDSDGTIVGIEENVPTMDDSTFEVGCPSSYVLELNAGWTRKHGVAAGQKVKLEDIKK